MKGGKDKKFFKYAAKVFLMYFGKYLSGFKILPNLA